MSAIPAGRAPAASPLRQAISRPMLLFFIVGDVLGAGIYALVGVLWFVNRALTGPRGPFDTEEIQLLEHPEGPVPVSPAAGRGAARPSS